MIEYYLFSYFQSLYSNSMFSDEEVVIILDINDVFVRKDEILLNVQIHTHCIKH
jgi:hypothetical protein